MADKAIEENNKKKRKPRVHEPVAQLNKDSEYGEQEVVDESRLASPMPLDKIAGSEGEGGSSKDAEKIVLIEAEVC